MKSILAVICICCCEVAFAYPYRIYTAPDGAIVKNILTNGDRWTPVEVDVSNTEAGSTFGISMYRHENVAIKIFTLCQARKITLLFQVPTLQQCLYR
jgi:tRNA G18 (ribose-2'-O)-methylase SpoU